MRILLDEDDLKIASFFKKGLEEAGFAVDHARDFLIHPRLSLNNLKVSSINFINAFMPFLYKGISKDLSVEPIH